MDLEKAQNLEIVYCFKKRDGGLYINNKLVRQFFTQDLADILSLLGLNYELKQLDEKFWKNNPKLPDNLKNCIFSEN